jgi:hypothetical protein
MSRPHHARSLKIRMRSRGKLVIVNDKMQRGYRYLRTEPIGRNFDPEFKPELTPRRCWHSAFSAENT